MLKKILELPNRAYLAFTGFVQNLKNDVRGLSGVVVAILLILVAVLAIVVIWGFMNGWLRELWERITGEAVKLDY
jgi:ABC-type lipoprotein release transport system permease subunit